MFSTHLTSATCYIHTIPEKELSMQHVNWQRTYYILGSIVFLGIILWAAWSVLGYLGFALILLLLSMAVAFLLAPAVNVMEKSGAPRLLATGLVYCVLFIVLVALGYA